jgi:hypothetical protein
MDDSLIAIGDAGTRRHGDAETRRHGEFAVSPLRRVAVSPLRLIALLIIVLALSGCAAPVRVEWTTETEMNTAGFNLYRGESADGPFDVKVNAQLIPPAADPLTGGKYQYVDQTARAGVTYYYRLEEVERNGGTNDFGPISVRAGGLEWWHVLILVLLGVGVAALWIFGRKRATAPRTAGQARADLPGDQKS